MSKTLSLVLVAFGFSWGWFMQPLDTWNKWVLFVIGTAVIGVTLVLIEETFFSTSTAEE